MTGWKSHHEVAEMMRAADIFAFPSGHEMGGGVVIEAMACGFACMVVDRGEPATIVGPDLGIKVPIGTTAQMVESFRQTLEQLVMHPDRMGQLGAAAHAHAMSYYSWDAKARKTLEIYEWVTGRRSHKPSFWEAAP